MKTIIINELLKTIEENPQGFTATLKGKAQKLKHGYAVSITNNSGAEANTLIIKVCAEAQRYNTIYRGLHFGGWRDSESGLFYLDVSIVVHSKKMALSLAKLHNQKAIFSFSKMQEIRV